MQTPPAGQPAPPRGPDATRRDPVPAGDPSTDDTTAAPIPTRTRTRGASRAEYNLTKVIAGGGAAATTAVVGSYFGAAGTVVGAALAAIVTSVITTTFQRGLDTTTRTVRTRVVRLRNDTTGTETTSTETTTLMPSLPAQRDGDPDATRAVADADGRIRLGDQNAAGRTSRFTPKRIAVMAGVAVVAFVIGLFVVTGIEWVKGSPISGGESGTSVGRVLHPAAGSAEPTPTAPEDSDSSTANDGRDSGTESTQEPSQRSRPGGGGSASRTTSPPTTTGAAPTAPRGGGILPDLSGSGAGSGAGGGG